MPLLIRYDSAGIKGESERKNTMFIKPDYKAPHRKNTWLINKIFDGMWQLVRVIRKVI